MILEKFLSLTLRLCLPALLFAAGGCAYKIEIQQGHHALRDEFDQLAVGMSQEEVEQLLGSLPTSQLFKKDTWIYTYQQRDAGFIDEMRVVSVKLVFDENGRLQEIVKLRDDYAEEEEIEEVVEEEEADAN